jgi:hypothetical protein
MIGVILTLVLVPLIGGGAVIVQRATKPAPVYVPKPETCELTQDELERMLRGAYEQGIRWGLELATEKNMDGRPVCGLMGVL